MIHKVEKAGYKIVCVNEYINNFEKEPNRIHTKINNAYSSSEIRVI